MAGRRHGTVEAGPVEPALTEVVVTYVEVGGLRTWHEVQGEGRPVVLLHGGFAGASSWAA